MGYPGAMKLRTQFLLLVGGIIAVPFLVSAFTLVMRDAVERGHEPLPNYGLINSWVRGQVPRALVSHDLNSIAAKRPPGLEFIVLDVGDNVTFSTIGAIASGTPAFKGDNEVLAYMRDNLQR